MGFQDYASNRWYHVNRLPNSAACAVARKTITDGAGTPHTLLAVLPMSAGYRDEWAGNFDVGPAEDAEGNGLHRGFKAGCDEILRFLKQYVQTHAVTGDVKIWTAGHSRGSALANDLGAFFAAGGDGYFENAIRVAPQDVYCYTFATPGTVAGKVSKARLLSVEGARSGDYAGLDTEGAAYAYPGADGTLLPGDGVFACIHNSRPDYDLITLLPPGGGWNFTVFGQEDLPVGRLPQFYEALAYIHFTLPYGTFSIDTGNRFLAYKLCVPLSIEMEGEELYDEINIITGNAAEAVDTYMGVLSDLRDGSMDVEQVVDFLGGRPE